MKCPINILVKTIWWRPTQWQFGIQGKSMTCPCIPIIPSVNLSKFIPYSLKFLRYVIFAVFMDVRSSAKIYFLVHFQLKNDFILGHLRNLIRENPDLWLERKIYILRKFPAIRYPLTFTLELETTIGLGFDHLWQYLIQTFLYPNEQIYV